MTSLPTFLTTLKARLQAATPGPWHRGEIEWSGMTGSHSASLHAGDIPNPESQFSRRLQFGRIILNDRDQRPADKDDIDEIDMEANATLIANAPTDLARCIAIIELQNAALKSMSEHSLVSCWAIAETAIQAADKIASGGLDE